MNMLDIHLNEELELKGMIQFQLTSIPQGVSKAFALSLFPVAKGNHIHDIIYNSMHSFYSIKLGRNISFQDILIDTLKKAKEVSPELEEKIRCLMSTDFAEKFKKKVVKFRKDPSKQVQNTQPKIIEDADRQVISFSSASSTNKDLPKGGAKNVVLLPPNLHTGPPSLSDAPKSVMKSQPLTKKPIQTLMPQISTNNANLLISDTGPVLNLSDQDMCFCGKHVSLIEKGNEPFFLCYHCSRTYHTECMKKSVNSRNCSFCHLRMLIPHRQVLKTLFVGLLKKGKKKHDVQLYLTDEDLSIQHKIQVRCFRIKENTQISVVFPDAVIVGVNTINYKQFVPLHRQSSLKIRKDEPFYLASNLHLKENKITLTERFPTKQAKDDRIEPETHLFGIYLINQKRIESIVKEIQVDSMTQFMDSKALLDASFKMGGLSEELSCEVVKIPLTCTLTTQKIKIPVRGVFCNHYNCLDLSNFLMMTSTSVNPRWICPLCKQPLYDFKIDCILMAILEEYKKYGATEVMFYKTGQFTVLVDDKVCKEKINNIYDLPIDQKYKRLLVRPTEDEKNKKKRDFVPQSTSATISLDD